jgi:hypothetical protein
MTKNEIAKKLVSETRLALATYIASEKSSLSDKKKMLSFIKESSSYSILHFAAKGFFPKDKTVPAKSLLEQAVVTRALNVYIRPESEMDIFSECCREVLASKYAGNKKVLNFIMNEASNYEVCHLAVTSKFPKNETPANKVKLYEHVGRMIENKYGRKSFITESFLQEVNYNPFTFKDPNKQYEVPKRLPYSTADATKYRDAASDGIETYKPNVPELKLNDNPNVVDKAKAYGHIAKDEISGAVDKMSQSGAAQKAKGYAHAAQDSASGMVDKLHGLIAQGKETGSQAMAQLQKSIGDHPDAAHAVGGVAAAALALYGANKLYKKIMGDTAKQVQGKPAPQAAMALKQAKMKATQAKVADLQKSMSGCKATKNPAQCQKVIADKIKKSRMK